LKRLRKYLRRLLLIVAILAAYAFGSQAFAQESAEQISTLSYPLTDQQKTEWGQFTQAETQQRRELQAIVSSALNVEIGPTTSIQFHAQIREAQLKLGTSRREKRPGSQPYGWKSAVRIA
jgi:uncharacterized membrane protein affecting hemolysin expression